MSNTALEKPMQQNEVAVRKKKSLKHYNKADQEMKEKLQKVLEDPDKSYDEILKYVQNEIKESTRIVAFNYKIKCFKEDGAYALSRAVESIHGFTTQEDEKNISGTNPPSMIDVRFADGSRKKVPFGQINLPSLGKDSFIDMQYDPKTRMFLLTGQCEKRFVRLMDRIIEETQQLVETDSIYKGQAIKITDEERSPQFIDLSSIDRQELFLTPDAVFSTKAIEARIEHSERCKMKGIDLRFGVLLEGTFGKLKDLLFFFYKFRILLHGTYQNLCFNRSGNL